jgi:hypothetical protein
MAGMDAGPTRGLFMGSAGLRAGNWRISNMVGHAICQLMKLPRVDFGKPEAISQHNQSWDNRM